MAAALVTQSHSRGPFFPRPTSGGPAVYRNRVFRNYLHRQKYQAHNFHARNSARFLPLTTAPFPSRDRRERSIVGPNPPIPDSYFCFNGRSIVGSSSARSSNPNLSSNASTCAGGAVTTG